MNINKSTFWYGTMSILVVLFMSSCANNQSQHQDHDHAHGDQAHHEHEHHDHGHHEHEHHDHEHHEHAGHDHSHHGHHHGHDHGGHANHHMNKTSFEELVQRFESPERDEYQKPEEVMKHLAPWAGKTVLDIGSGTGYFSFRMAEAGAKVIAGDVDERFQNYIKEKQQKLGISTDQLTTKLLATDSPGLSSESVDRVMVVNTYHHIENRIKYFSQVKSGLKPGGDLVIVDFKMQEAPVGPPLEYKIPVSTVEAELMAAGFEDVTFDADLLDHQYIVIAK